MLAKAVGRKRDGGIDGIIKEDKLGLDVVYIQAKRWRDSVGPSLVQAFAGALKEYGHEKASHHDIRIHADALEYVQRIEKKIYSSTASNLPIS